MITIPSTVIDISFNPVVVHKGGFIIPHTLQLEGKKSLDSQSFSNGLKAEHSIVGR
jgi:methionyl-tRNA formyltransferase